MIVQSATRPPSPRREHELAALRAAVRWGAADPEVVDAIAVRLRDGDGGAWVQEWTAAGGEAWASARSADTASMYLHAASCYAAALALIDQGDGWVDEDRLWERQRECWDRAVERVGGERLSIAYEQTTLPGYFFSGGSGARPLVVIDHGGRVATSVAWTTGGAAATARGCHWMTFDGPGRQAALRRQGLVLRPDWEAVLTPVLDAMVARPDIDRERVVVVGIDHAGYGVHRALALERRFAAAVVAPGVVDASGPLMETLPPPARTALEDGDRESFDRELHLVALFDPEIHDRLRRLGREYDQSGVPLYDVSQRIARFRLGEELAQIATPMLVCPTGPEPSWAIQAEDLCARAPGAEQLRCDGPDDECVWDWLDQFL
ncbi:MAG: alpha/beta hydrolase family protein [Solirubrobacteraceae bacterium]